MPIPPQRCRVLALAVLAALSAGAGARAAPAGIAAAAKVGPRPLQPLPVAQVRAEFRKMCETLRDGDNPYLGTAQVRRLERALVQADGDERRRVALLARLGVEHMRLGDNEAALLRLGEARRLAARDGFDPELRADVLGQLALAHLRQGEQANCVARHGPASCILPLAPGGVHRDRAGSLAALQAYTDYVGLRPDDAVARWLLNVAAMTAGRYPDAVPTALRVAPGRFRSDHDVGRFPEVAGAAGLSIRQQSGGAVVDDFDGDGLLDVVTTTIDPCGRMNFFRNDGRGGFEDRTVASGLDVQLGGLNLVHADADNDGDLDLLVLRGGWLGAEGRMRNSLLRNDGAGRFDDVTPAAGLAVPAYPTQTAAWADYDGDGDLDLYVGNEWDGSGRARPSQLFRNDGAGRFEDVAGVAGVTNDRMAKGVTWGDYDNDGDPDLYVSNVGPNRLYRNDGKGAFTDVAPRLGLIEPAVRSFATWFFDFDNDGNLDIFVAAYEASLAGVAADLLGRRGAPGAPRLYRNRGDGTFEDAGARLGLQQACMPMGANFGDLDNDGWLDFYLGTGLPTYESIAPNLMYRNNAGRGFQDVTYSGGFGHLQKGHGVAFADLDNDGDQDVFEQMGGAYPGDAYPSVLYENPGHGNAWITLRLVGRRANRSAIGARIEVVATTPAGRRSIHVTVSSGGSFGGSSLQQEIGLGDATAIEQVRVRWPGSGSMQTLRGLRPGRFYEIVEGTEEARVLERKRVRLGRGDVLPGPASGR